MLPQVAAGERLEACAAWGLSHEPATKGVVVVTAVPYTGTMHIGDFADLLSAARQQTLPQQLLFVFLKTRQAKDWSEEQRRRFDAGNGGALQPQFCVALSPEAVGSFENLVMEADKMSTDWDKLLVACVDDTPDLKASEERTDGALKSMVARVEAGADLTGYLCFRRDGSPLQFA